MTTSAIVVSFQSARTIADCVRAAFDAVDEVIVVDNASIDGSDRLAADAGARVIRAGANRGYGTAVNLGVANTSASTNTLVIVNPDAYITPEAVESLRGLLMDDPEIGLVSPQLVGLDGSPQPSARPFPTIGGLLGKRTPIGRLAPRLRARGDTYLESFSGLSAPTAVPWVLGAVMVIRRSTYNSIGGFDEAFFLYGEDVDLCARLWGKGRKVVLDPTVTVVHEYARESSRIFDFRQPAVRHHWRSMARLAMRFPGYFFLKDFDPRSAGTGDRTT